MVRSAQAKHQFLKVIADNDLINGCTRDSLAAKTQVVYPAVLAPPLDLERSGLPNLFFMGRTFVDKGGLLAVAVLERLREVHGQSFKATVVAACPPSVKQRMLSLGIEVQPIMERGDYLNSLALADIFFSPTLFENFGMGLLEAAAFGAAMVTSCGPGMEHIEELFENRREALLVSNELSEEARVAAYVEAIGSLMRDPDLRRTIASNAHALVAHGRFSLARHHRYLAEAYSTTLDLAARNRIAGRPDRSEGSFQDPSSVLVWSEQMCHWTTRRLAGQGSIRICV
jgi:glycosyltransferase involved in cell wall biosynthesis